MWITVHYTEKSIYHRIFYSIYFFIAENPLVHITSDRELYELKNVMRKIRITFFLERASRIELPFRAWQARVIATIRRPQCAEGRNRTADTMIFSHVLYP